MDGVETSDIDPSATPGTPFGYYIFQKQQPKRNNTASRYFATSDGAATQESVPNPAGADPRPLDEVLFEGYKDYTTVLQLMGDLLRYTADLNRLRGMRQLPQGARH